MWTRAPTPGWSVSSTTTPLSWTWNLLSSGYRAHDDREPLPWLRLQSQTTRNNSPALSRNTAVPFRLSARVGDIDVFVVDSRLWCRCGDPWASSRSDDEGGEVVAKTGCGSSRKERVGSVRAGKLGVGDTMPRSVELPLEEERMPRAPAEKAIVYGVVVVVFSVAIWESRSRCLELPLFDALYWGVNLSAFKLVVLLLPGGLVDGARFGLQAVLTVWTFHRLLLVPNEFDLPRGTTGPRNCSRLRALACFLAVLAPRGRGSRVPAGLGFASSRRWVSARLVGGWLAGCGLAGELYVVSELYWLSVPLISGFGACCSSQTSFACPAERLGREIARVCEHQFSCCSLAPQEESGQRFKSGIKRWSFGGAEAARELRESFDRLYLSSAGTEHAARLKRVRAERLGRGTASIWPLKIRFLSFFRPAGGVLGVWAAIQVGDESLVVWWADSGHKAARELRVVCPFVHTFHRACSSSQTAPQNDCRAKRLLFGLQDTFLAGLPEETLRLSRSAMKFCSLRQSLHRRVLLDLVCLPLTDLHSDWCSWKRVLTEIACSLQAVRTGRTLYRRVLLVSNEISCLLLGNTDISTTDLWFVSVCGASSGFAADVWGCSRRQANSVLRESRYFGHMYEAARLAWVSERVGPGAPSSLAGCRVRLLRAKSPRVDSASLLFGRPF
ncbi:hypothetical protein MIND_01089500 [Mycena indigotica]|uniref:Uncharacterized protein n=1 Tax=Mycena indigotica TaxID=2126181 RepID=A0A8H6SB55_9AGAR|nr:uncharacterized protein MIND_01089500 [Mycena indigotica]KAF7295496.1 hypothetical protein MIND_01089500 [Mycena indigotica]